MRLQRLLEKRRKTIADWLFEENLLFEPIAKLRERVAEMGLDPLTADEETVVVMALDSHSVVKEKAKTAADEVTKGVESAKEGKLRELDLKELDAESDDDTEGAQEAEDEKEVKKEKAAARKKAAATKKPS